MKITKTELNRFKKHVLNQYPNEACAVVVDYNGKLKVINCDNTHDDKLNHFRIDSKLISEYVINGSLKAVLHSHIAKSNQCDIRTPSASDIQSHIDFNIPFGIVATDGLSVSEPLWLDDDEISPLEGRSFVHGIADCWSIVRDYYRLHKRITLKNYAREPSWWINGQNLCTDDAIQDNGFVLISYKDLQEGDVILMKVASPVPNHWAVVTGNNTIIHQLPHRLSREDQLSKWSKFIVKCYRHKSFV